jgi:hypothetical protein
VISNPVLLIVVSAWFIVTGAMIGIPIWFYSEGSSLARFIDYLSRKEEK